MSPSSSLSAVLGQLADLAREDALVESDPVGRAGPSSSLVTRLSRVVDRRKRRGLRHELVVVLVLAACATLVVGNDSLTAIWQWSTGTSQEVLARLGARRNPWRGRYVVPSERTFRRVLGGLDGDGLDRETCGFATDVVRGRAPVPVLPDPAGPPEREQRRVAQRAVSHPAPQGLLPAAAVDGKALRGARTGGGGQVCVLGAISHDNGVVLGQRQIPDKKGEASKVGELLAGLDAAGMVFTLDALHTTRTTARLITDDLHAHYLLILKGKSAARARGRRGGPGRARRRLDGDQRGRERSWSWPRRTPPDPGRRGRRCPVPGSPPGLPSATRRRRARRHLGHQGDHPRDHQSPRRPGQPGAPQPLPAAALDRGESAALDS